MIRYSQHRGALMIRHRPDLCQLVDHRGIAEQFVGLVLCRVFVAHRDRVCQAWWSNQAEEAHDNADVRLLPGSSEPPIAFRLVG